MKSLNLILTLFIIFGLSLLTFGQGITGSGHDFSGETWNPTDEICIVCHTPHMANSTYTPLWNHQVTAVVFTPYTSPTFNGTATNPMGTSRLCLSCHDGTVGLEAFGGTTTNAFHPGNIVAGDGNLSSEHPIAFDYLSTHPDVVNNSLHDPATTNSGNGGTIASDWLFSGSLECASCHDVHNKFGNARLLRVSNSGSALCLTCHNK